MSTTLKAANPLYLIYTRLLVNSCLNELCWKAGFSAGENTDLTKHIHTAFPAAQLAFHTYLHMELLELQFNTLFHLNTVYIMWPLFKK